MLQTGDFYAVPRMCLMLILTSQVLASALLDKDRSADITRSYVQKSLCLITRKGLYGLLQVLYSTRNRIPLFNFSFFTGTTACYDSSVL